MEIIKKGVKSKTQSKKLSNSIKSKADKPEIVEKSVNLLSQLTSGAWCNMREKPMYTKRKMLKGTFFNILILKSTL
jgi:hypothetical protein